MMDRTSGSSGGFLLRGHSAVAWYTALQPCLFGTNRQRDRRAAAAPPPSAEGLSALQAYPATFSCALVDVHANVPSTGGASTCRLHCTGQQSQHPMWNRPQGRHASLTPSPTAVSGEPRHDEGATRRPPAPPAARDAGRGRCASRARCPHHWLQLRRGLQVASCAGRLGGESPGGPRGKGSLSSPSELA